MSKLALPPKFSIATGGRIILKIAQTYSLKTLFQSSLHQSFHQAIKPCWLLFQNYFGNLLFSALLSPTQYKFPLIFRTELMFLQVVSLLSNSQTHHHHFSLFKMPFLFLHIVKASLYQILQNSTQLYLSPCKFHIYPITKSSSHLPNYYIRHKIHWFARSHHKY